MAEQLEGRGIWSNMSSATYTCLFLSEGLEWVYHGILHSAYFIYSFIFSFPGTWPLQVMRKVWLLLIFFSKCLVQVGAARLAGIRRDQGFPFICCWASRYFCFENGPCYFSCSGICGYPAFAVIVTFFHVKILIFILCVWKFRLNVCGAPVLCLVNLETRKRWSGTGVADGCRNWSWVSWKSCHCS